jgi:hypothetical protein
MKETLEKLVKLRMAQSKITNAQMLEQVIEQIIQMNKRDLEVIAEVLHARAKLSAGEFRYLGRHARDNALGKAVRVPSTEFPWVKNAMIHLARATQSVNNYMYNFGSMPETKQAKLMEITAQFNLITDASKKINKLATYKRPSNNKSTPKTLKEAKKAAIGGDSNPEINLENLNEQPPEGSAETETLSPATVEA